jgi:NADH:ubiquinone oxidoreductase subunit 2 (subunit N)
MDYYFLSIVAIFTSIIGAAYYLRIIKFIYFYDDVFMPYYINCNTLKDKDIISEPQFTLDSLNEENNIYMMPSNSLSLVIAILTNLSLFYVFKPYVLINAIYMITIPLFQN